MTPGAPLAVLYVDDDADIREIVGLALGLDPAISVRAHGSAEAALDMLRSDDWQPDLILLDVMMPRVSGSELLKRLREQSRFADTPVVFITAKARQADLLEYKSQGALGAITKPFDPLGLAEQLRGLMRTRAE